MAVRPKSAPARTGAIKGKTKVESAFDKVAQTRNGKPATTGNNKLVPKDFKGGISFTRLLANGLKTDSKYLPDVHVTKLRLGKYRGWPGFLTSSITIDNKTPRRYNHHVVARDGQPVHLSKQVHATCQCPRFLYYYEYALHKKGAADIIHSNGEFPIDKNPMLYCGVCKHLIAVMLKIRSEGAKLQAKATVEETVRKIRTTRKIVPNFLRKGK